MSRLVNRNVIVFGLRTSMRLEPRLWDALREIFDREGITLSELVERVAPTRTRGTTTSSVRVYVVDYFRAAATDKGHRLAGHGAGQLRPSQNVR